MKKIYTLVAALVLFLGVANAQNSNTVLLANDMIGHVAKPLAKPVHHAAVNHQKSVQPFWIDLDSADAYNAASLGLNYSRFRWDCNMHYTSADTAGGHLGLKNQIYVVFDTLVDSYNAAGPFPYSHYSYPTVSVDSIMLRVGQENNTGQDDTLVISILGVQHHATCLAIYPDTAAVTVYSRDTLIIPASAPLNPGDYTDGMFLFWHPSHPQLPTNTFCVKVEYFGAKQDSFMFVAGCPSFSGFNSCASFTMADSSSYHPNSFYKDNVQFHQTYPTLCDSFPWYECNSNSTYSYGADGSDYVQNIGIMVKVDIGSTLCNNLTISTNHTDASCGTCLNGTVSSTYSGGTSPYTFLWSNGASTQNITGLNPGTFTVTITDVNNCTAVSSSTVVNNACGGFYTTLNPTAALCATCADGWVSDAITGGTSPFTFAWSNGSTSQNATGLLPGTYSVTITDNAACVITNNATITNANLCNAHYLLYPDTAAHTYWIVNQAYGTAPVHYDWNWGDASAHDTIAFPTHTYAAAGNYTITLGIHDAINCATTYANSYYLSRTANQMVNMIVIPNNTGIPTIKAKNFISLQPNPNDGNFYLAYHLNSMNTELKIMDLAGRVVYHQSFATVDGREEINAHLGSGIYYWVVVADNEILDKGKIAVMK